MHIEIRSVSEIRPYDRNPRINDQAVDAVARSIQEFGFRQPIVVAATFTVIVRLLRFLSRWAGSSHRRLTSGAADERLQQRL